MDLLNAIFYEYNLNFEQNQIEVRKNYIFYYVYAFYARHLLLLLRASFYI